jgi:hypothetical protein
MIRIDENTYIDDTLVTCAEYQLFIDDQIHEHGKFYHPYHWTTNQFPEGKALEPILGVQSWDAKVFCEWLTQQEKGDWKYRLPKLKEAMDYPTKTLIEIPFGYWTMDPNRKTRFTWIGSQPTNPRSLSLDRFRNPITEFPQSSHVKNRFIDLLGAELNLSNVYDGEIKILGVIDDMFERRFYYRRKMALDLSLNRSYRSKIDQLFVDKFDEIKRNAVIRHRVHYPEYGIEFSLPILASREDVRENERRKAKINALDNEIAKAVLIDKDLSRGLNFIIDICTLQERIAGRSPAFEGIRLVKERKP